MLSSIYLLSKCHSAAYIYLLRICMVLSTILQPAYWPAFGQCSIPGEEFHVNSMKEVELELVGKYVILSSEFVSSWALMVDIVLQRARFVCFLCFFVVGGLVFCLQISLQKVFSVLNFVGNLSEGDVV